MSEFCFVFLPTEVLARRLVSVFEEHKLATHGNSTTV